MKALLQNLNQKVKMYMINSINENVELTIPPVELQECVAAPTLPRTFKDIETNEKEDAVFAYRFAKLLENLHLEDLNGEERKVY